MPADSIETLLKFEDTIEPVIKTALEEVGVTSVYTSRVSTEIATPCLSVALILGATNGHLFKDPASGFWMWDQWAFTLIGTIRTNRGQNADSHAGLRAKMRLVVLDYQERINPNLTYHHFADLPREDGTDNAVDDDQDHDISTIRFSGLLAIKRDAWPTS